MKKILFSILFLFIIQLADAQLYLALDKPGITKRIKFFEGDMISIKVKDQAVTYTGEIRQIRDSAINVNGMVVPLNLITAIVIKRQSMLYGWGSAMRIASVGFFIADILAQANNHEKVKINPTAVKISGALAVTGWAIAAVRKKTYRINKYRSLKILGKY